MKLLRIVINGREAPHYTITNAFKSKFAEVDTIWFQQLPTAFLHGSVMQKLNSKKYDAVFMQIQQKGIVTPLLAQEMAKKTLVFNWTGDVRSDLSAYTEIGKYCITLFSNATDVETFKKMGLRSEYLQCGYDHIYFYDKKMPRKDFIVFCANNYPNTFPLSGHRTQMVNALREEFKDKFRLYGQNWTPPSLGYVNDTQEADLYNTCAIAISYSHFNYKRYYSRRLLVEMACSAFVLSHEYPECEKDFKDGEHLVIWKNINELIDKSKYYLAHQDEARRIAETGCNLVTSTCKWTNRVDEFIDIFKKYSNG